MISPFVVQDGALNPTEALVNDLNSYAGRGFPVVVQLQDPSVDSTGPTPSSSFYGRPVDLAWIGTDNYYGANQASQGANVARTPTADVLTAVPFIAQSSVPITNIGFFCVNGVGSPRAKLGVYGSTDDLNGIPYPGTLLYASPEFIPNSNQRLMQTGLNIVLTPGRLYWMVIHTNTWSTSTIQSLALASTDTLLGTQVQSGSMAGITCIQVSYSYANPGPPATFPAGAARQTFTPPFLFYGYDFPVAVRLHNGILGPFAAATATLATQVFPSFSPTTEGWIVRGARLLSATIKASGSAGNNPYLVIKARLRNAKGTRDLGTFDSRRGSCDAGVPFPLTGVPPIDQEIPVGTSLEVYTEQFGTTFMSLEDMAVSIEVARGRT